MDRFEAGPNNREILWDNKFHVSEQVWSGIERGILKTYCGSRYISSWQLSEAQKELLDLWGFGLFKNTKVVLQNDKNLISALVERWRPETHTFHMRPGEMTITLEDVGYILGLPTMGEAITCGSIGKSRTYWEENWFERLDVRAQNDGYKKGGICLNWIHERYSMFPGDDPTRINLHTKAYILYICGTILFPTSSRNVVHPRYLVLLQNASRIHSFAWGAAVLAYLYNGLDLASCTESKGILGCTLLLQVWSYERLLPGRPIVDKSSLVKLPVTEGWTYIRAKEVLGKRRLSGPHHNLQFYRGEFDGVAGDVVEWLPYSRFGISVNWNFWEAGIAGQAQVPLICFDVVEIQYSDRVTRQFGYPPYIPRTPYYLAIMRKARAENFVMKDYRRKWFVEIGQWTRFCEHLMGLLDNVTWVSVDEYMNWYKDISRARVGMPTVEPEAHYRSREMYDNAEGLRLIECAMTVVRELDARLPPNCGPIFADIASKFVSPCASFLRKLRGPSYNSPVFEHIRGKNEIQEAPDILNMTQPSQMSDIMEDVGLSEGPSKNQPRRMKQDKWKINKPLSLEKIQTIHDSWGWGPDKQVKLNVPIVHPLKHYTISQSAMRTLAPERWVEDTIINAYQILLRNREQSIEEEGIWRRSPVYFFMDPFFVPLAKEFLDSTYVGLSKNQKQAKDDAKEKFFLTWASKEEGPSIQSSEFIFFPTNVNDNHWVLFIFSTREWMVLLIDPLYNQPRYKAEIQIMQKLVPQLLRYCSIASVYPDGPAGMVILPNRPKQKNADDCGVFVMKYMDYMLQGYDLSTQTWSDEDVIMFRYRIAKEIQNCKARPIPGSCMQERLAHNI